MAAAAAGAGAGGARDVGHPGGAGGGDPPKFPAASSWSARPRCVLADGSHRSPAEEAGVMAGDIIVEAGGEPSVTRWSSSKWSKAMDAGRELPL